MIRHLTDLAWLIATLAVYCLLLALISPTPGPRP